MEKKALFAEVKRNEKQYSEQQLRNKTLHLQQKLGGYHLEYRGFSLRDL